MSKAPTFGGDSGSDQMTRNIEAVRLIKIITDDDPIRLSEKDRHFVAEMDQHCSRPLDQMRITPRQLFWLRDIKDRLI